MLASRRLVLPCRVSNKSGLSRAELLFALLVVLIFAAVAWFPISDHLEKAHLAHAVESARTINTLLTQYATDNNGVYPIGENTSAVSKSEGVARDLLQNNYTPDASIFAVGSTAPYSGKASDFSDITAANLSWDFTAGATATEGITSNAPDLLPTVYSTGQHVLYPTAAGVGLDLPLNDRGPFGAKGVIVAYKGNNAVFIPAMRSGQILVAPGFISKDFKNTGTYMQITP
jgi:type II secretory pathway pseudopilin PulG